MVNYKKKKLYSKIFELQTRGKFKEAEKFIQNIENNIKYIRSIAPHANPNKLLIKLFEDCLGTNGQIAEAYEKYPYTKTYDCSSNFAPITLFNYQEMINFK